MKCEKDRIDSLEALRILCCIFVIILHFNNSNGGALGYTKEHFWSHEFVIMLEGISICAVNIFMILSGYFGSVKNERKIIKPIMLIFTVMGYSSIFIISMDKYRI